MALSRSWIVCVLFAGALTIPAAAERIPHQVKVAGREATAGLIKEEFLHAWKGYEDLGPDHDELNPVSMTAHEWTTPVIFDMTAIDAFDTMELMGLNDAAAKTKAMLLQRLSFDRDASVQVFEITIRVLGGLLSAYQLTGDEKFLTLATDLGTRMLPAFDSPTGMPYRFVNLKTGAVRDPESNPAEIGTLILEFGTLAKLTKRDEFYAKPKRALVELFNRRSKTTGLVGETINIETGAWVSTTSHVGSGIDSYYEYLVKCERLFGDAECGRMARETLTAVNKYLADETKPGELWYGQADINTGKRTGTLYGSLEAFFPTVFVLTGDIDRAVRLQDSNLRMWKLHHVEPETLDYKTMTVTDPGYKLRPEIVESAYYLRRVTGDPKYLDMGQTFFDDLKACCRVANGYTILTSVTSKTPGDRQHSFFLAETLKYLYLIFAPDETLDFDHVTFNTEAHPLRRTW